ncbi:MAG: hypothetical protein WD601_10325 [Pseudohongiellaceae bacterium]
MMQDYTPDSEEYIDRRIVKLEYRNYDLVARYWEYSYMGKIWKFRKAVEEFDANDGQSIDELIAIMKHRVDELIAEVSRLRQPGIPVQAELNQALARLHLSGKVPEITRQALTAHNISADGCIESVAMERLTGLSNTSAIFTLYSHLAVKLCDEIGYSEAQPANNYPGLALLLEEAQEHSPILTLSKCARKMIHEMGW